MTARCAHLDALTAVYAQRCGLGEELTRTSLEIIQSRIADEQSADEIAAFFAHVVPPVPYANPDVLREIAQALS